MTKRRNPEDIETCAVVDQFCDSPANVTEPTPARCACFACGEKVCSKCSSMRKYFKHGMRRICNNCQIERIDGNNSRVLARIYRMAGYTHEYFKADVKRWRLIQ